MFCLIYISNPIQGGFIPQVLEISKNKSYLLNKMQEKAFHQCIDHVGRKNYVDTLSESDLTKVVYPLYPNMTLKKVSDSEIQVCNVEKLIFVEKGYIYNSTKELLEINLVGTYYVLDVEQWKYEDLPERPQNERPIGTSVENSVQMEESVVRNYDRVILQLVEAIQKRKVD